MPLPPAVERFAVPPGESSVAVTDAVRPACAAWPMLNDRGTVAGAKLLLPACDAASVHVPAATMATVNEATVQMSLVVLASDTVRPDDDVGATVNVDADQSRSAGVANVIVCGASTTWNVRSTALAAP